MGDNKYIGARYVPIYAGEWDNTKAYEPLTIVSYQGDSYTSRGYVAVGVDISNTQYWARTGIFNQQVAHLEDVLDNTNEELDELGNTVDQLGDTVDQLGDTVDQLGNTVDQLGTNKLSKSALKDMFVIERKVIELTIGAGMTSSGTANIEKTGYSAIALTGWQVAIFELKELAIGAVGGTGVAYSLTNPRDTSQNGQLIVFILYVKNS